MVKRTGTCRGDIKVKKARRLQKKGRNQARVQRKILNGLVDLPSKVFVSPLGRAIETARPGITFSDRSVIEERLQEIYFGNWEGALKEDVAKSIPQSSTNGSWAFDSPKGVMFEIILALVQGF